MEENVQEVGRREISTNGGKESEVETGRRNMRVRAEAE